MAALIDTGLIEKLGLLFPFLLVLVVVYGFLQYKKPFGEKKEGVYGLIAFVLALLTILYNPVVDVIKFMAPWFIIAALFLFFLVLMFMMLGAKESDIAKTIKDKSVIYWIITFMALILVLALGKVLGPQFLSYTNTGVIPAGTDTFQANIFTTVFHPKILGTIFVFVVAAFAIKLLSSQTE